MKVLTGEAPELAAVRMHGLRFCADLLHGQKTGMFLDQRENYLAAARYAHGRALDCFTSSGGFALHMAARCESVEAADSSAAALRLAEANRDANGIGNVQFHEADVFELLAGYVAAGRKFRDRGARPSGLHQVARRRSRGPPAATRRSTCGPCACWSRAECSSPAPARTT